MGFRSRLKGAIKRAVTSDAGDAAVVSSNLQAKTASPPPQDAAGTESAKGNLADGEDVPWYLQEGDLDGWDSTDGKADSDED